MVARSSAQPTADVEAIDIGQHQVEQHHVGDALACEPQTRLAILGDDRLVTAQTENPGNQFRLLRMILHDQSRSHRSFPRASPGSSSTANCPQPNTSAPETKPSRAVQPTRRRVLHQWYVAAAGRFQTQASRRRDRNEQGVDRDPTPLIRSATPAITSSAGIGGRSLHAPVHPCPSLVPVLANGSRTGEARSRNEHWAEPPTTYFSPLLVDLSASAGQAPSHGTWLRG